MLDDSYLPHKPTSNVGTSGSSGGPETSPQGRPVEDDEEDMATPAVKTKDKGKEKQQGREDRSPKQKTRKKKPEKKRKSGVVKSEEALAPKVKVDNLGANIETPTQEEREGYSEDDLITKTTFELEVPEMGARTGLSLKDLQDNASSMQNKYKNAPTSDNADQATFWEQAHLAALGALRRKIQRVHGNQSGEGQNREQKAVEWNLVGALVGAAVVGGTYFVTSGIDIGLLAAQGPVESEGSITYNATSSEGAISLSEGSSASTPEIATLMFLVTTKGVEWAAAALIALGMAGLACFTPTTAARGFTEHLDRIAGRLSRKEDKLRETYRLAFQQRCENHMCELQDLKLGQPASAAPQSGRSSTEEV